MKPLFSLLALVSTLTFAQAQTYIASLDGAQDGGGGRMGSGMVTITLSGTTLTMSGSYQGLTMPSTAAHIHGPALPISQGGPPGGAGVLYSLGNTVIPLGSTAGAINGTVNLAAGTGGFTLQQQFDQLNSGLWYVNI